MAELAKHSSSASVNRRAPQVTEHSYTLSGGGGRRGKSKKEYPPAPRPYFLRAIHGKLSNSWRNQHVIAASIWEYEKDGDEHKREVLGLVYPTSPMKIGGEAGLSEDYVDQMMTTWGTFDDEVTGPEAPSSISEDMKAKCDFLRELRDLRHDYMMLDDQKSFMDWINPACKSQTLDFSIKWLCDRHSDWERRDARETVLALREWLTSDYKVMNAKQILEPSPGALSILEEYANRGALYIGRVSTDGSKVTLFTRLTPERKFRKNFTDEDFERAAAAGLNPKMLKGIQFGEPDAFIKWQAQVQWRHFDLEEMIINNPEILGPFVDSQTVLDYVYTRREQRCGNIRRNEEIKTLQVSDSEATQTVVEAEPIALAAV